MLKSYHSLRSLGLRLAGMAKVPSTVGVAFAPLEQIVCRTMLPSFTVYTVTI